MGAPWPNHVDLNIKNLFALDAFFYIYLFLSIPFFPLFHNSSLHTFLKMANINEIANQFTTFYYQTFDTQRQNLTQLYVS